VKVRPILKKLLRVFLTSLIYVVFFLLLNYLFLNLFKINQPAVSLFITLLIVLFYHEQITAVIRYLIDKSLYRKFYAVNQALNDFNLELNTTLDLKLIIEKFSSFLRTTFHEHQWAFYYRWGEDYELFAYNVHSGDLPKLLKLPKHPALDRVFKREIDFFILQKLMDKSVKLRIELKEIRPFDFHYFLPLRSYKGYNGFLLFDRKFGYYLLFASLKKFLLRIFKKTADVFENDLLYSEVERKSLQNFLLIEIGKKISSSLDLNEVLETIIDSVNLLLEYDAGGIFLIDETEPILRKMVTRGYDKNLMDKLLIKIDQGLAGWVIKNKVPSIINDVSKTPDYFEVRQSTRSQLTVPLMNGKLVHGVMSLESDRLNHFTPMDQELLMTFASQAMIAIENAQLFEASTQKKRLESELVVASKVQKALLPDRPPDFPGLKISFMNIPSRIVGGDFYDIFKLGENKLAIAIGDVSGKGAPAAILMAMLYAGFRSLLKEFYPVVEVVARLNNLLVETTNEGYFCTFFFGIFQQANSEFVFTNAGHNPPLVFRKDGSVKRLTTGGVVLGFLKDREYRQESIYLKSGDYLFLFTDGVTEVRNSEGEEFGEEGLIRFLKKHRDKKPQLLRTLLFKEIKKFSSEEELADDATFAIIYVE
jgi:sigma-B regulation protein RsbU (phosphoserine phosphatase)